MHQKHGYGNHKYIQFKLAVKEGHFVSHDRLEKVMNMCQNFGKIAERVLEHGKLETSFMAKLL